MEPVKCIIIIVKWQRSRPCLARLSNVDYERKTNKKQKQKSNNKKKKNPKQTMDREKNCYECTDCSVPIDKIPYVSSLPFPRKALSSKSLTFELPRQWTRSLSVRVQPVQRVVSYLLSCVIVRLSPSPLCNEQFIRLHQLNNNLNSLSLFLPPLPPPLFSALI